MRRIKKAIITTALTVTVAVAGVLGFQLSTLPTDNGSNVSLIPLGQHEFVGPLDVVKVIDGDTIMVTLDGKETKIRLIGVDTPETVKSGTTIQWYGKEASDFTKKTLEGNKIILEFDKGRTDIYNRTLAYVYLDNGDMLNVILLNRGYGKTEFYSPNTKYKKVFLDIESKAKLAKLGRWSEDNQKIWESQQPTPTPKPTPKPTKIPKL